MMDRAASDLPGLRAHLLVPDASNRNRRRIVADAIRCYPRDPVVLYAYIAAHIHDAMLWSVPGGDRAHYPFALGRALASAFEVLAQAPEDIGSIRPALARVSYVAAALLALEDRPDPAALDQAARRLDAYRALDTQPLQAFEKADWFPESHYHAARGRLRAWQAVLKTPRVADQDFAFVADYLEARDLRWAFDPLVILPEFQHWARQQLAHGDNARLRARKPIEFDCAQSYRNHATVPDKHLPDLILGRLLAALLAGRPNLTANAWRLSLFKLPGTAACLDALCAAGLDPDARLKDGQPLLHYAVERSDAVAVWALLAAGADPGVVFDGADALGHARDAGVRRLLSEALNQRAASPPRRAVARAAHALQVDVASQA